MLKEWISAADDRTRDGTESEFDHTSVESPIKMNDPFIVSSEELMYPGDDSMGASAGNIINCRCVLGYVRS